jgi:hypothetical protein
MINLNDAVSLLREKRKELLEELEAIDKALAALTVAVLPTRLPARRTLSDEHKHALTEGRRKARHSKDVAVGFARELPERSPTPASSASREPRLVKRTRR